MNELIPLFSTNQANGVIAAFVIAKTFSRVKVSYYCDGLVCGDPVDFSMFQQSLLGGVENVILFVAVAIAIEALVSLLYFLLQLFLYFISLHRSYVFLGGYIQ